MGAQNVRRCNRSIEGVAPGGFAQGGTKGPSNFRICSGSDARFISMAGRKTRHPQRNLARNPHPLAKEKIFRAVAIRLGSEVADKNPRIPGRRDVSAECAAMRAERAPGKKLKDEQRVIMAQSTKGSGRRITGKGGGTSPQRA